MPKITVYNRQRTLPLFASSVQKLLTLLLEEKGIATDSVIVYFVNKQKIAALHAQYFNDPSPTDCITFPMDSLEYSPFLLPHTLGEMFICPKVAQEYALDKKIDPYEELTLYCIHCFLHMLGYDDLQADKRRAMRKEEKRLLGIAKKHHALIQGKK